MSTMNNKYTFIDLFTGAGGLYRGFKNAGMEHLLSVEIWKPAIDTLKSNYPDIELYEGDIRELDAEKLQEYLQGKQCDVLVGGPPCQGFSTIGKRLERDPRNELVFEFIRIVNIVRPKFFIMENSGDIFVSSKFILFLSC